LPESLKLFLLFSVSIKKSLSNVQVDEPSVFIIVN
jgi:hypothetical protein